MVDPQHATRFQERPGVPADDFPVRATPETFEYESTTVGVKRKTRVHTPPGSTQNERYPVLYLLHGIGGDENEPSLVCLRSLRWLVCLRSLRSLVTPYNFALRKVPICC